MIICILFPLLLFAGPASAGIVAANFASATDIPVTVAAAANSNLSEILLSSGVLNRSFSPTVTVYETQVDPDKISISVTPTVQDPSAKVMVNGVAVISGTESAAIPLAVGDNAIQVVVTAIDATTKTYTINVIRTTEFPMTFNSEATVPVSVPSFTAARKGVRISLNFVPSTGTNLMAINNTGLDFITGSFSNLIHGQIVDLTFNGKVYPFVANFYGGSGNDLVLEWPYRSVVSWGSNSVGQLGNGGRINSSVPVSVIHSGALAGKIVLYTVSCHSACHALCSDGTVVGWGYGGAGALGNGSWNDSSVPVVVSGLGALAGKRVISIAAGNNTVLAICSDGTVASWGDGTRGQLGNGRTTSSNIPVAVARTSAALLNKMPVAAAVGGFHCLVLFSDGTVFGWGHSVYGQVGDGSSGSQVSTTPGRVILSTEVQDKKFVAIGAGLYNSLGLCSDGTVVSWGSNRSGEQGSGLSSSDHRRFPAAVRTDGILAGKTVSQVSTNGTTCLALCTDGTMAWWGNVSHGLNTATGSGSSFSPILVDLSSVLTGRTLVGIGQGDLVNFAIFGDGSAAGWGRNASGQVGDGSVIYRNFPVMLEGSGELYGKKAISINGGGNHAHAVLAEPATGYISWLSGRMGMPNKTELADPDMDGIPNIIEYVLDGNPTAPSSTILPEVSADESSFIFSFTRLAASQEDTTQIFQYSPDMIQWTDVKITAPSAPGVGIGSLDVIGNQSITVNVPKGDSAKMFGRLRVARP